MQRYDSHIGSAWVSEMLSKELFVPGSMDDLSSEWLQMALADSFPRSRFTSLSRERIGEAFGFASQIYRCGWQEGNSRQSVVVKLWSTDSKAGVQEALFYRSFKGIGIRIPQYHYSAINEKNNKAVLVLEDLMDAVQGAILSPLDLNRAKNIALMIARMHGTWLSRPKRSDYPWLPESSDWNQTPAWLVSRKMECVKRFDKYLMGFSRQLLGKMELAPEVANERLATAPATLCHDDFHLDNIMFERQSEPVLLDWS
ncbi:MAG: phosphotransferase, partial [Granulosicoccus sp.]